VSPSPDENGDKKEIKWTLGRFWKYIEDVEGTKKTNACRKKIKDIIVKM